MKLRPEQLESHVGKTPAPIYVVSGDDPLLAQEACDSIRAGARAGGFTERVVFEADRGFDWNSLAQTASGMSLFAERRLIELRLPTGRPGDAGARALGDYAERPAPDNLLLVVMPRIDDAIRRSKWFKALDSAAAVVQLWPPEGRELTGWVARRMKLAGLQPDDEAVALLTERIEGNLLACVQEIEKIRLLNGPGRVDADAVIRSVADSARYDVFTLVDSALGGDAVRCVRIIRGLQGEGVEPTLTLWALTRAIRAHAGFSAAIARGEQLETLVKWDKAWSRRQALIRGALQRHPLRSWWRLLRRAARVDRTVKGQAAGNVHDELLQLSLMIAGVSLDRPSRPTG